MNQDEANPFQSPEETSQGKVAPTNPTEGDATGGIIPYKNGPALAAYYLGILGMLPCIGLLFSLPAFVLGIMGLQKKAKQPEVKGSVHAWIGIILGGIFSLLWGLALVGMIVSAGFNM